MSLTLTENAGPDLPKLEKGIYQGTCFRIVDLGTSEQTYQKETSKKTRVCISFEITDAIDPIDNKTDMEDGRPYGVSKTYTAAVHEAAALRKHLESWRGKSFTDDELAGFDISKLLGCTARIEIGHTEATAEHAGGNPKILNLQRPDGGVTQVPTKNEMQSFDMDVYCDEFNCNSSDKTKAMCDIFEILPVWQQEDIQESFEYLAAVEEGDKPKQAAAPSVATDNLKTLTEEGEGIIDDEIPF